ncbi:hypothetical protein HDK77DRAFT_9832 [Phyllosticta capitalensis]
MTGNLLYMFRTRSLGLAGWWSTWTACLLASLTTVPTSRPCDSASTTRQSLRRLEIILSSSSPPSLPSANTASIYQWAVVPTSVIGADTRSLMFRRGHVSESGLAGYGTADPPLATWNGAGSGFKTRRQGEQRGKATMIPHFQPPSQRL